jgi:hypothetical protein
MTLRPNTSNLIKHSRTIKWGVLAGVMSGVEAIVPLFNAAMPRGIFAALSFVAVCGALWARLLVNQRTDE